MKTATPFSLIGFQDALIARFHEIEANGIGRHKSRSRGLIHRTAIRNLVERGYEDRQARQIVDQAWDMWKLEQIAEVAE